MKSYIHHTRETALRSPFTSLGIDESMPGESPNIVEYPIYSFTDYEMDYNGSNVIYAVEKSDAARILVPGRQISRDGDVSQVDIITDPKEMKELTDLIRAEGFRGNIRFWD